jgi:hypothetical protein
MFIASMTPMEREKPARNEMHYATATDFKRFRRLGDNSVEAPTKKAYN